VNSAKKARKRATQPTKRELDPLIAAYEERRDEFDLFRRQVLDFFLVAKRFNAGPLPLVHSVKSRLKDSDHLREKIIRKWKEGPIAPAELFSRITDLAGVRVMHLYSQQFREIHTAIDEHVTQGYWHLHEPPVAYSWDPEATAFFTSLGAKCADSRHLLHEHPLRGQASSDC
jgi:putative GTP pyrophosphokinase